MARSAIASARSDTCARTSCLRSTSSRVVPQSGQTRVTKPSSSDARIRKSNGPSAAEHLGSRHRNQFVDTNVSIWASVGETSCSGCVRNLNGALHAARKFWEHAFAPTKCPARSNACDSDMRRRSNTDRTFRNKCRRLLMPKCQCAFICLGIIYFTTETLFHVPSSVIVCISNLPYKSYVTPA